ncbi:hypothetical protein [Altericroceibacterium xinjiangense]|uniref:hypothetical protein n=1 Tax=Altericroceibacterium xinjiangense TaxID=762261 RepID=UPI000F7E7F3B|nr:hypothetical protein [Altericroceibacterium xinjiangense]
MTLMNGLAMGGRARIWTDTAWTDPHTGKVIGYGAKAFETPLFPSIVAMTTVGGDPNRIMEKIGSKLSLMLGGLLEACENALREFVTVQPGIALARLLVAGWCYETDSARLFLIHSEDGTDANGNTWPAFAAQEISDVVSSEAANPKVREIVANGLTPDAMLRIAEIQRAHPIDCEKPGIAPYYGIGGTLLEHEVTRAGVTTRAVKEWGEPVKSAICAG